MAQRKSSSGSTARGVVHDITRKQRGATRPTPSADDLKGRAPGEVKAPSAADEPKSDSKAERIEVLREKVARGEYNPDPHEVARKLLERGF